MINNWNDNFEYLLKGDDGRVAKLTEVMLN